MVYMYVTIRKNVLPKFIIIVYTLSSNISFLIISSPTSTRLATSKKQCFRASVLLTVFGAALAMPTHNANTAIVTARQQDQGQIQWAALGGMAYLVH